ncbi:hypothetical protein [Hymenobacter glacieicola]|uniref:SF4 helicase domain-containing protein n=1 Tax=Hymenobacter glacieicola TaxID=1562124 RepID=A0ABQ1X5G8_9BACT|nr:hypothetical protein [Hymenobacter glacieicola]GGG60803.1 hypothetical protein GCM10011378_41040 [Hymenobacter glacieicola]
MSLFDDDELRLPAGPAAAPEKKERNYESGIWRVSRVKDAMLHGYTHGKPRGTTTYFREFDQHWTHKQGEVTLTTGYANMGKSEMLNELMVVKSAAEPDKRWGIFSPENTPADEFYDSLVHKLTGFSADPDWCRQYGQLQVSLAAYERAMEWIESHFIFIYPEEEAPTLECLMDYFDYLNGQSGLYGVEFDPWNQITHLMKGQRDDQYLSEVLSELKRWTVKNNYCTHLTAHPTQVKKGDGPLPVPDQFLLNQGAMFGNKLDNILANHRPNYHENKADTAVQWWSHKIKKQKRVGRPGFCDMDFNYLTNRYSLNGESPLDTHAPWLFKGIPLTEAGSEAESRRVTHHELRPLTVASTFEEDPPF